MDERFSPRALEMSHWSHNLCSLHSPALTSPQLISYAYDFFIPNEKCISPPADLHASARSKESAWERKSYKKRSRAVAAWIFIRRQKAGTLNAKHRETRSRGKRVLGPLHREHRFSAADCLKSSALSSSCQIPGVSREKCGGTPGVMWPGFHLVVGPSPPVPWCVSFPSALLQTIPW